MDQQTQLKIPEQDEDLLLESNFVGLKNQGATCYLNSLLQLIFMTPEMRNSILKLTPEELGLIGKDEYLPEQQPSYQNAQYLIQLSQMISADKNPLGMGNGFTPSADRSVFDVQDVDSFLLIAADQTQEEILSPTTAVFCYKPSEEIGEEEKRVARRITGRVWGRMEQATQRDSSDEFEDPIHRISNIIVGEELEGEELLNASNTIEKIQDDSVADVSFDRKEDSELDNQENDKVDFTSNKVQNRIGNKQRQQRGRLIQIKGVRKSRSAGPFPHIPIQYSQLSNVMASPTTGFDDEGNQLNSEYIEGADDEQQFAQWDDEDGFMQQISSSSDNNTCSSNSSSSSTNLEIEWQNEGDSDQQAKDKRKSLGWDDDDPIKQDEQINEQEVAEGKGDDNEIKDGNGSPIRNQQAKKKKKRPRHGLAILKSEIKKNNLIEINQEVNENNWNNFNMTGEDQDIIPEMDNSWQLQTQPRQIHISNTSILSKPSFATPDTNSPTEISPNNPLIVLAL
ncbi:MAG: hypothetical protein EZS28_009308 [Streblomastix strix]|uniref:Peptidase C19 ubiquitin carboxyl-terminal hydrolase domain-containing protein n=1 Tax=Streblomastix strix TaxID=222440 RepID=A0A5J4WKM3_9EUKA|nr:MAG: hypothetical protein EZS28_009308 [Streblomastix strix]